MPTAQWPPSFRLPSRHVVLFIGAVIVPCAAFIVTGSRMLSQDRELAEKRDADERRRLYASAGQEIVARLDLLRSREELALLKWRHGDPGGYADPATVLVAPISRDRIRLPWEGRLELRPADSAFAAMLERGQRLESANNAHVRVVAVYDSAVRLASDEDRRAYAQLLAARSAATGGFPERFARLREVSRLSFGLRDEFGVPIALYAERRLIDDSATTDSAFADRIERELLPARDLSPTACSVARFIVADFNGAARSRDIATRCTELDHAEEVADRWQQTSVRTTGWSLDESRTLLCSATASGLTIVSVDRLLLPIVKRGLPFRLVAGSDRGEMLSSALPALRALPIVTGTTSLASWESSRNFQLAALGLVLAAGLGVGFLFWRDMQRELHLAALRSHFVAGVSHELKTPLTAIRMYAETLRAGRPRDPAARSEYLDTIVAESERLSRLLDNVLDFAKIERGTKNYAMQPHYVPAIVDDARRIIAHTLSQRGFEVDLSVDRDIPPAVVDADAVEQAVLNLIVNAMKYSGDSRRITLRVRREDTWVVITVSDSGIGIAAPEQDKIFAEFYRSPSAENANVPGAGLGLTIVRHIAAAHHGHVTVTSAIGRGSTFSLYLPLVASQAMPRPTPAAAHGAVEVLP